MVVENVTLPSGERKDIHVQNGVISFDIPTDKNQKRYDAKGAWLLPKIVDLNVRLCDGILSAKTINKVAKQAKQGGVGTLVLQPDSTPSVDDEVVLEYTQNSIKTNCDVTIEVAINTLKEDLSLSNIAILLKKGGVVPFMSTIAKNNIAMRIAEYAKMYKTTLFVKAEDNSLISQGVMFEGDVSSKLGLAGIPELSEVVHVSRMIEIAKYYGISILFKAIASPRSLAMIQKAKKEGVDVKAEVSLLHLLFSDKACEGFNTLAKIDPPLVEESMRCGLVEALKEGRVDTLTLLHQPNSPVNKEVAFFDAGYGSGSLGYGYALYYTKLVQSGILSMEELVELVVYNPKGILKQEFSRTIQGARSSGFILLDTTKEHTIQEPCSLYNGEKIYAEAVELESL